VSVVPEDEGQETGVGKGSGKNQGKRKRMRENGKRARDPRTVRIMMYGLSLSR